MVNATKKTILLLSLIMVSCSCFSMMTSVLNKTSELFADAKCARDCMVLPVPSLLMFSKKSTVLLSAIAVGSTAMILKNQDYIEDRSILAVGGITISALTSLFAANLTPEQQLKRSNMVCNEIEKNSIIKHREAVENILNESIETKHDKLRNFLVQHYSLAIKDSPCPINVIQTEVAHLSACVNKEAKRTTAISSYGNISVHVMKKRNIYDLIDVKEVGDKFENHMGFLKKLLAAIVELPGYAADAERAINDETIKFKKEKYSFLSRINAITSMLASPAIAILLIVLIQQMIDKCGFSIQLPMPSQGLQIPQPLEVLVGIVPQA